MLLQQQLRRRREEEERIAQQNEFLRASLRGSRKLQALQDGPIPQTQQALERVSTGVDNDAYIDDEEAEKIIGKLAAYRNPCAILFLSLDFGNSHIIIQYNLHTELILISFGVIVLISN